MVRAGKCDTNFLAEADCKEAAAKLGLRYKGHTTCKTDTCAPRGCYHYTVEGRKDVYWNNDANKKRACESDRICICTKGTVLLRSIRREN